MLDFFLDPNLSESMQWKANDTDGQDVLPECQKHLTPHPRDSFSENCFCKVLAEVGPTYGLRLSGSQLITKSQGSFGDQVGWTKDQVKLMDFCKLDLLTIGFWKIESVYPVLKQTRAMMPKL